MHRHHLDNYSQREGRLQRLPAAVKMIFAIGFVVVMVVVRPSVVVYAGAGVVIVALAAISNVPAGFIVKRLLLLEPFVLGVAVMALFRPGGAGAFAAVVARTSLCILMLILLANTTPFSEILAVLRRARVPGLMVTTLALMHRYLFVLREEAIRMHRARTSRTFARRRRGLWRMMATVISELFIRAVERSERIYAAMCARGWE